MVESASLKVERALQHRYDSRTTLRIKDEYDIQDLLRSLLSIYFDDVSAEDPSPKFVGSSTRVDLLLRKERIAIEIKKTRSSMTEGTLGKELKLDIVDYKQRTNCDALVILVDDRKGRLKNSEGFANDLMKVEESFGSRFTFCGHRYRNSDLTILQCIIAVQIS